MKKIYCIFFFSVTIPVFLTAQQKAVNIQPKAATGKLQPAPRVTQPSHVNQPSLTQQLTGTSNGEAKHGSAHRRKHAPTTYGNEWINFSQYYYKIKVGQNGIYRIDSLTLARAGIPVNTIKDSDYQLFFRGQQQYIYVRSRTPYLSEKNGDYIEFYGQYNDSKEDSLTYYDIKFLPNPYFSLFTDTSTYYLTWGSPGLRMTEQTDTSFSSYLPAAPYIITPTIIAGRAISNAASNDLASNLYFLNSSPYCPYSPGAWTPDGGFTPNDPRFTQNSAWVAAWIYYNSGQKFYPATDPVYTGSGAPAAFMRTVVLGVSNGNCTFNISLSSGPSYNNIPCNAFAAIDTTFTFPAGDVTSGLSIKYYNNATSNTNIIAPAYIYLSYPHTPDLTGDSTLSLFLNDSAHGPAKAYLGFTNIPRRNPADTVRMYDLTNHNRFWIKHETGGSFNVLVPNTFGLQQCFLTSDGLIHEVTSLTPVGTNHATGGIGNGQFTNFSSGPDSAYIIITHPLLWSEAQAYASYRSANPYHHYSTVVANVEELYDQFGYGVDYSPLGIRRFCEYAINKWNSPPSNLFLIGKGIHTPLFRPDTAKWTRAQLLVPSFGYPSSDILFTSTLDSIGPFEPAIPTGRLAAATPEEVSTYLSKVETYESATAALWMKKIAHFAGGDTYDDEQQYANDLDNYANTIQDTLFGGHVYLFQKSTPAPINTTLTDSITTLIDSGVSIMTFFGHASGTNWDESVDYPSEYNNVGRYPFMMADACFSGDIYQPIGSAITSISEQWVLTPPGAIGFLASDYLGNPAQLDQYTQQVYDDISYRPFYRKPIGQIIQNTISHLQNTNYEFMICTLLELNLHGDPAISINAMDSLPDYAVNNQSIYFTPSNVTVLLDSFKVNIVVYNYGEALNQAVPGILTRTFPNGVTVTYPFTVVPPKYPYLHYTDTVSIKVPVNDSGRALGAGLNYFSVSVDLTLPRDTELTYNNNSTSNIPLLIVSEDITPVWPYDYAIIPADTVTLKASTNDPFAPQRTYIFEIDTSHSFNSPLFRSDTVTNSGGVIMLSPYANWGSTHFNGLYHDGGGISGNKMMAKAPAESQPAVVAPVQKMLGEKPVAAQSSAIGKLDVEKQPSEPVGKQAAIEEAAPHALSTRTMEPPTENISEGKAHKKRGPIEESFLPNSVYYWRVRRDTADSTGIYSWVNSSFQYIKGKNGWGQSNFFQYDNDEIFNDDYNFVNFNSPPRGWSFDTNGHTLQCTTYGELNICNNCLYSTQYTIDNFVYGQGGCQYTWAIIIAVIDKITVQPWNVSGHSFDCANSVSNYKNNACLPPGTGDANYFIFWDYDPLQMQGLIQLLDSVPNGDYILAYSWMEGAFKTSSGLADAPAVVSAFNNLGATQMPYHANTPGLDSVPWIFFVQKGVAGTAKQVFGTTSESPPPPSGFGIHLSAVMKGNGMYGNIVTPLIGPAAKYDSLSWSQHSNDHPNNDSTRLNIIGVEPNGTTKTLEADITPTVASMYLSSINPTLFPYIQLMLYTKDITHATPAQMNWWRVFYQPVPEIAMNPNVYTYYHADTLQCGDKLNFQTTVQNISDWPIDSTQLLIWTATPNNIVSNYNPVKLVKPLNPGDTAKISFTLPDAVSNANTTQSVWFEINPEDYPDTRLEQYHFNNYAEKTFYSYGDKINPVLDVTFDGIHILNNDIVSAQPNILVTFMDENKFLAMNNPADFKVYLNPVGGALTPATFSFTPATLPQNRCSLLLSPTLADGTYQLTVQGTDISGNLSAQNSYTVDFQVINKPMISEVLNYPNPFSTSTRFVFILTGSEIPNIFKIQIMTVTGKIVREINEDEIGPIHIGRNITQYAWDGTDQYGAKLANGVYLYRVITSIDGQSLSDYQTGSDQYFTKGWGKMYLMR